MTQPPQPPRGPDDAAEHGWDEPDGSRPRLYPVPTPPPPDPAPAGGPGAIPWGNSPEELLDAALRELDVLTGQVRGLEELVRADRADHAGTGAGKFLRFRYERQSAADAAAAHAELTRWVSWLVATYQLTDAVPPCWDRHDALAEELAGFYVAWQNVWADEGPYDAAAVWHEQLHSAIAARWPRWLRGARCSESCALDTEFAAQAHRRWGHQAATAGGADYRLARVRQLAPPIPPTPKTVPATTGTAKAGKPGRSTTKAPSTSSASSPTTGRTRS